MYGIATIVTPIISTSTLYNKSIVLAHSIGVESNLSNAAYSSRIFSHSHTRYQLALPWLWRVWFFILCLIHRRRYKMAAILQTAFSKPLLITEICCISFLILQEVIPKGSIKISHIGLSISLTWNRWEAIISNDDMAYWRIYGSVTPDELRILL